MRNCQKPAKLMESLGVKQAYNLDGGQSAKLVFLGQTVSTPYKNGRRIGDAIVVVEKSSSTDITITEADSEP